MSELMLKNKRQVKFNVELSRFHINRIINDNNITLKITRIRHVPVKRLGKNINININTNTNTNTNININVNLTEFYEQIK